MSNSNTIKAIRAIITLGDIHIDGYQLPDGNYKVSTQTFKDTLNSLIGDSTGKKYLKPILEASKSIVQNVKIDGYNRPITMYGLDTFSEVVAAYAQLGNQKAIAILVACMSESLERRFDNAFDIIRSEQERNERFIMRRDGIVSRNFWTDCIDAWMLEHPELVSENYKRFIYINVSDMVNKAVLGTTAKKFRESLELPEEIPTRDYLTTEQLKQIDTIEKAAGMRVKRDNLCPKQAVKDVISLIS
jgi:hypothetical protein